MITSKNSITKWSTLYWKLALLTPLAFNNVMVSASSFPNMDNFSINIDQQSTISGRILDQNGIPLSGVTIKEKGTQSTTVSNNDGRFSLKVSSINSILLFSSLNYKAREIVASSANSVILEETSDSLEEVVVVAYGTQKKSNMTSAVSQVDTKILQNRPSPSIANMLQGAAPGLVVTRNSGRPGAQGLNLQIRGASSADGNVNPLYVIDGMISTEGAFLALNTNDIENISILKDGGATAIYGAQSAGGVVLVSTKGGKPGRTIVSASSNLGVQSPKNIPARLSLIDEMNYVNLARANAGIAAEYSDEDLDFAVNGPTFVLNPTNGLWRTFNQQSIIDQVVQKSYNIYNNNVQISGGGDNMSYLASLGHMSQNGMFKVGDDKFGRLSARVNLSAKINNYMKLDIRSAYVKEDTDNPQDGGYGIDGGGNGILRQFFSSRMRFPIFNEDGSYYRNGTSSAFGYALLKDGGFNTDRKNNYFNNFGLTINNFVKGLEFRLMYGREDNNFENRNFRRTVTYYSGPNSSTQLNNPNNYAINNYNTLKQNTQAIVDYKLSLKDTHNLHVMGGYQWETEDYKFLNASTKNLYVNDNPSLNFTSDPLNKSNSQGAYQSKMQSYFGRLSYNYLEKYLLEATIRSDESSKLTPGNRVKIFPSLSLGWNVSKESWFENISETLNDLKIRGSWGKSGLQKGIGYFDHIAQLSTGTNVLLGDTRQTYSYQSVIPATNIGWETIENSNIGLDFAFLNRKLTGSFDYYNKYNNNMLVPVSYPATIGIAVPRSNDGKLKSWGWELGLAYKNNTEGGFRYNLGVSLSDNKNKLERYSGSSNIVYSGVNSRVEGYALNSIWAYQTSGYFQDQNDLDDAPSYSKILNKAGIPGIGDVRYVDINGDNEISAGKNVLGDLGDLVYLGDINPRYQYGVNVDVSYKNFDLSLFIQGIAKRKFKPANELIQPQLYSWYLPMDFHMDYWTPENTDAAFPRPYLEGGHNFQNADKWFLNGAYARLKNIQIGYTLSRSNIARLPFSRVRFYVSGEDVLTVSKLGVFKGVIDPEMKPEDGKVSPYPFATTVSFGLNIDL